MKIDLFDYELPAKQIAQVAIEPRDSSNLMVVNRQYKSVEHRRFSDIADYLLPGDLLVINDTKVIPARLFGEKNTGAKVEVFLLKEINEGVWETLCKPGKRVKKGTQVFLPSRENSKLIGECLEVKENGNRICSFETRNSMNLKDVLFSLGTMPLPPYIHEKIEHEERYQTVYSDKMGAVAAPTAGLHFTDELYQSLINKGIEIAKVTLHVGIGTFRPVSSSVVEQHVMHSEEFHVDKDNAQKIFNAKKEKRRIVAVGTTSVRVLEHIARDQAKFQDGFSGTTDIYIYPPYDFKMVDMMITNFHLPKSSLLIMLSAFAGRELIMSSYRLAIENDYRFYSLGDACFFI